MNATDTTQIFSEGVAIPISSILGSGLTDILLIGGALVALSVLISWLLWLVGGGENTSEKKFPRFNNQLNKWETPNW